MKFLFQPVKPFVINQKFGENTACFPISGEQHVITCDGNNPPLGYKSAYGAGGHKGVDLQTFHGQPVYASCDGVVDMIDTHPRTGLDVRILSVIEGQKYLHIYEHLMGYNVQKGQFAKTGDCIGWADNTGFSSGDHLHFELKRIDQGVYTSIDPIPFMNNYFAPSVDKIKAVMEKLAVALEMLVDKLRGNS